jgi:hypothetical protein
MLWLSQRVITQCLRFLINFVIHSCDVIKRDNAMKLALSTVHPSDVYVEDSFLLRSVYSSLHRKLNIRMTDCLNKRSSLNSRPIIEQQTVCVERERLQKLFCLEYLYKSLR